MQKKEFKRIYNELKDKKVEILNRLLKERASYFENFKNEGGDLADEAAESIERELIYDLSVTEKNEVDEMDTAISKIEEGSYGSCETCGNEIPMGRLKIKPYAKYCTKCREIQEKRKVHPVTIQENE